MALNKNIIYVIIAIIVIIILYFIFRKPLVENLTLKTHSKGADCPLVRIWYLANTHNKRFDANWTGSAYYTPCGETGAVKGYGRAGPNGSIDFVVAKNSKFQFGPMGTNSSPIDINVKDEDLSYLAYGSVGICTGDCNEAPAYHMVSNGANAIPCGGDQCHSFPVETDNKTPAYKHLLNNMSSKPSWMWSTCCAEALPGPPA
jgi:hypothetical protein